MLKTEALVVIGCISKEEGALRPLWICRNPSKTGMANARIEKRLEMRDRCENLNLTEMGIDMWKESWLA